MPQTPSLEALNLEIRVQMVRAGKRQGDLAEVLGTVQSQVARRLNGEIEWKVSEVIAVAGVLGVEPLDLFATVATRLGCSA